MYDIETSTWSNQTTTSEVGGSNVIYGGPILAQHPAIGIPQERKSFCTVASRALDKTSYGVYILGGVNGTFNPSDAWVLSLPAAVWIRLPVPSETEFPKYGMTCNLLSAHYVLLYDGCYYEGDRPCVSYGHNPQLYDVWQGVWTEYIAPPEKIGFKVPYAVSRVIGGE